MLADMARKIIEQLVDDIDGTVLEPGSGETVTFSLDRRSYEADLSDVNANALRDALAPYVAVARKTGSPTRATSRRSSVVPSGVDLAAVRAWAKANGHTVSDRGRVSAKVLAAYEAAQ